MANSWLRLWHDMPNDPKWRTIARISGQPIALVQAVYLQLLVSASQNPVTDESGVTLHVTTITTEDIASSLDVTELEIESVTQAMQGRVLDGELISGWEKRQAESFNYKRTNKPAMTGAERARRFRDRKKSSTKSNSNVTEDNVTQRDGNGVTGQIRLDKKRIDKELKDKTLLSHGTEIAMGPDEDGSPHDVQPETSKSEKATRHKYPPEFETAWQAYPRRPGSQDKHGAYKAWTARRREGISTETMLKGVLRYAAFVVATGKSGTEFIKQAKTFFGPSLHFEDDWQINIGGSNAAKNSSSTGSTAWQQVRDARNAERAKQGLAPLGDDGSNILGPVGEEEWRDTIDGLDGSDFEILG